MIVVVVGGLDGSQAGIDSTVCRVHQHAADAREAAPAKGAGGSPDTELTRVSGARSAA
ncbi:hypothetical protein OG936_36200 [Streptomyces sp. NBC_00846]|uniref:hypothetical protein n=1 Tax=Streptomyces sp. NBC_00846 TaxID=2975849 RepID=UPI003869C011|nr:hypothetical protein OG936_36200 [Streptomyces sp. NBC_00846]